MEKTLPRHFKNINRNLVDNGYGQITNNVFMYAKGVEEFYKVDDIEGLLEEIRTKQGELINKPTDKKGQSRSDCWAKRTKGVRPRN